MNLYRKLPIKETSTEVDPRVFLLNYIGSCFATQFKATKSLQVNERDRIINDTIID